MDQWEVLIHDHLPGYITWERYESNLRRLARNSARAGAMRAAREGDSLLAGLVSCGRCGRRMMVAYTGKEDRLRYSCQRGALDYAEPRCQSLAGGPLDELVGRQVLLALEPAALELSLRAVGDAERERDRLDRQWRAAAGAGPVRGGAGGPAVPGVRAGEPAGGAGAGAAVGAGAARAASGRGRVRPVPPRATRRADRVLM